MFPGSPAALLAALPLRVLSGLASPDVVLGVWLRTARRAVTVRWVSGGRARLLLLGPDLGYLLRRCDRVAVRDGAAVIAVPATRLIKLRVLEIVLGTPYLPPAGRLRELFPAGRVGEGRVTVPIGLGSPEEALALCASARIPVAASRISYVDPGALTRSGATL